MWSLITRSTCTEEVDNLRAAIDAAFEKVEKQYRRQLDKVQDHHPAMKEQANRLERGAPA